MRVTGGGELNPLLEVDLEGRSESKWKYRPVENEGDGQNKCREKCEPSSKFVSKRCDRKKH